MHMMAFKGKENESCNVLGKKSNFIHDMKTKLKLRNTGLYWSPKGLKSVENSHPTGKIKEVLHRLTLEFCIALEQELVT